MLLLQLLSALLCAAVSIHADSGQIPGGISVRDPQLGSDVVGGESAPPVISSPTAASVLLPDRNNNGNSIRFTSVRDGQVITVDGERPISGVNITATLWSRWPSQKWMLVRRGDVYLILPMRQHKEWANFLQRTQAAGSDNLPAVTVVLGIDVQNGMITQQVLHGRSNQHWEFKDAKEGRILIMSPARGKCIQEKLPKAEMPSFFRRTKDKIKGIFGSKAQEDTNTEPLPLVAADCEETDLSQLWRLEPASP